MKNKLQKSIFLVLFLTLIFSFTGCGKSETASIDIEDINWTQRIEKLNDWNGDVTFTEYDGVKYIFQSESFDEDSAKEYLGKIATLLKDTDTLFPGEAHENFSIYVGFDSDREVSITSPLTVPMEESLSFDTIWEIMKRAHRNDLISAEQYGLLYVYCRENGILENTSSENNEVSSTELKQFFENTDNLYFLDFCLPMLDNVYFTEEQASMIREAVRSFADWYENTYSFEEYKELCKTIDSCDKDALIEAKNEWLTSLGCTSEYKELNKIPFRYSKYSNAQFGVDSIVTYEFETVDAIWMWDDLDVITPGYVDMVTNYNEVEPRRLKCFADAREFLKDYIPDDLDKVYLFTYFERGKDSNLGGDYDGGCARLVGNWGNAKYSLLHEYVHHLTYGAGKMVPSFNGKFPEWIAAWISTHEVDNPLAEENTCELFDVKKEGWWDYETEHVLLNMRVYQTILEKYNTKETLDTSRTIEATEEVPWPVSISSMFYPEYGTLAKYVYETFGMDKLVELVQTNNDFEGVLGISFDQLYFDMVRWVQAQVEELEPRTIPQ